MGVGKGMDGGMMQQGHSSLSMVSRAFRPGPSPSRLLSSPQLSVRLSVRLFVCALVTLRMC